MQITSLTYPTKSTDVMFRNAKNYEHGLYFEYSHGTTDGKGYFVTDDSDIIYKDKGFTIVEVADGPFSSIQVIFPGISLDTAFLIRKAVVIISEIWPNSFLKEGNENYQEFPDDYLDINEDLCISSEYVSFSSGPSLFLN